MNDSNRQFTEEELVNAFKEVFPDFKLRDIEGAYYQAFPFKDDEDAVHYELIQRPPNSNLWYVEFHVEVGWPEMRSILIDLARNPEGARDFEYSTYYSSSFLGARRPALTPEQVKEDAHKLRQLIEPKIAKWKKTEVKEENVCERTGIQNLMPLADVLKLPLTIPEYQRPYCWRLENVIGLMEDLKNRGKDEKIHLGIIILKKKNESLEIIDGQQRLITLSILAKEFQYVTEGIPLLSSNLSSQNTTEDAIQHLLRAKQAITHGYNEKDFGDNLLQQAVFSVVTLDENENDDLAFTFFSHTNASGKPLSDYDLLKTHHLRYLDNDERLAQNAALNWNNLSQETLAELLHHTLFRLRKWNIGEQFSVIADDPHLREVFKHFRVEMDPVDGCSSWPCPMRFDSILDGGREFFSYVEKYKRCFREYLQEKAIVSLRKTFACHSNGTLCEGMLALCFLFYCKFGEHFLPEAVYCIAYRISQLRNFYMVRQNFLSTQNVFRECTVIINRATLEGEVFARLLDPRKDYVPDWKGWTSNSYWEALGAFLRTAEDSGNTVEKVRIPKAFHKAARFKKHETPAEAEKK